MNLEIGEKIQLNNNEEYTVMYRLNYEEKNYVFLMNNDKDLVIKIGEEVLDENKVFVRVVKDKEVIKKILEKISGEKIS